MREDQRLIPTLPKNDRLVGFLNMAYPECRVINLRRDLRDIALSMWKSRFSGRTLAYTYRFDWMSAKFNLYAANTAL